MKVMEKIIRDELYVKCQNRISDKQYGFLPNKSCVTQMTYVIDDIVTTINKHNDFDIVYFDFAEAFDSVKHDIILKKLNKTTDVVGHRRYSQVKVEGFLAITALCD